jgi:hypothetical protein
MVVLNSPAKIALRRAIALTSEEIIFHHLGKKRYKQCKIYEDLCQNNGL